MTPTIKRLSPLLVVLAALLALLAGCAVLRVDVDVYKGPLADEEHVQIQRLAVLAVGARPLLLQARNRLISDAGFKTFKTNGYQRSDVVRYEPKCVKDTLGAPSADGCSNGKLGKAPTRADWGIYERAGIINDILLLYDNINNYTGYEPYISKALSEVKELRKAANDLAKSPALNKENIEILRRNYPSEYKTFVEPLMSDTTSSTQSTQDAVKFAYNEREQLKSPSLNKDAKASSSLQSVYKVLKTVPALIFQARTIVRTLISALVDNEGRGDADNWYAIEQRKIVVRMTLVFLNIYTAHDELERNSARYSNCSHIRDEFSTIFQDETSDGFREKAGAVGRQLFCAPREFGRDLFALDKSYGEDAATLGIAWLPNARIERSGNWLARVDNLFERIESTALAVSSSLYSTIDVGALSAGRVGPGLEQLMREYLEAQHDGAPGTEEKKRRLADALIQFAQKMLFVSNNSIFLSADRKQDSSAVPKIPQESESLLNCEDDDLSRKDEATCANILSVIEVVGNSILVQANELHARDEHKKDMTERGDARRKSIAAAFSGSSITVVDSILSRINTRKEEIDVALAPEAKLLADQGKAATEVKAASSERDAAHKKLAEKKDGVTSQEKLLSGRKSALEGSNDPRFLDCLPTEPNTVTVASELARFARAEPCAKTVHAATSAGEAERKERMADLAHELQARASSPSLAAFRTAIAADNKATEELLAKSREAVIAAEANLSKEKAKEDDKKKVLADVTAATDKFRQENAELARIAERYTPVVMKLLNDTAKKALNDPRANPASIHLEWLNLIQASNAAEVTKSHAASLVSSTPSPISAPPDLLVPGQEQCGTEKKNCPPDAMASMDALIAWLQSNRTRILADYGEKSDVYLSAEAAIKQAQLDRAGMTYIRPASSYLRSSYPASSLQQNLQLGWQNMLGVSYKRGVPLLGGLLRNDSYYDTLNTIDKQFWQNINTVRVSGGGRSNYVLVNDDTGNFTVRSFSTNYDSLLKSFSGMALFNYGEKLGASLALNDGTPRATGEARLTPSSSGMGGLFASYRDSFAKERLVAYSKLVAALKSPDMASSIKSAWDADTVVKDATKLSDAKQQLDNLYEKDLKAAAKKVTEIENPDGFELIYETLSALHSFKKDLSSTSISNAFTVTAQAEFDTATAAVAAANARPESDPDKATILATANLRLSKADTDKRNAEAAADKAKSIAIGKVNPLIATVTANRDASIREYERALAFIGEAANRDAAPDPVAPTK